MSTNAHAVKEFTEGSTGKKCLHHPIPLDRTAALFIIRMVMSELDELAATVTANAGERDELMAESLATRDKCNNFEYGNKVALVAAQADSMVDAWYYMLNTAAKHGINLSRVFDIVHAANMAKRDPKTGQFIRRPEDGKVDKPPGWQPPNVEKEIERQINDGAW